MLVSMMELKETEFIDLVDNYSLFIGHDGCWLTVESR